MEVTKNTVKINIPVTINLDDFVRREGDTVVWAAKNYYTDDDYFDRSDDRGEYTPIERGIIDRLEEYIFYNLGKSTKSSSNKHIKLIWEAIEPQISDILTNVKKLLIDSGDIEKDETI